MALRFGPGATVAAVSSEVHAAFGPAVTTYDPRASASAPLQDLEPLLVLATVLSLIVGAGVTANSAALAAFERRREIGLLRAAGASSRQVFRLFAAEVATVAAAGVPLGVVGGLVLGALFNSSLAPADLATPALMPQGGQVVAAIAAGLGASLVGGLLPLFAAARLPILDSLRPHPIGEHQRPSMLLRVASPALLVVAAICFLSSASGVVALGIVTLLLGLVVALPLLAPLVIRLLAVAVSPFVSGAQPGAAHLIRARNRTAMTTAGLAIAVATAVGASALTAGALTASDSWVSHLFAGDTLVTSPVTQNDQVAAAINSSAGVAQATALRFLSETVAGASEGVTAIDPAAYNSLGGLDVVSGDRTAALNALENGPSFLEPAGLAAATGWTIGSQLPVQTQNGIVYFTVVGMVSHSFPSGDGGESLIMADDLARTYFGATADGFDDLVVTTHGSAAAVSATAASYGMRAVPVSTIAGDARDALQHSIGLLLAVAHHLGDHRHAGGCEHAARERPSGDARARPAARRRTRQPPGDAPGAHRGGAARRCGDVDRCRGRVSHRGADAPGEQHRDLRARVRLSIRNRGRADPRRRAGGHCRDHGSGSQSRANLSAQRAASRVAGCAPSGGGGCAVRRLRC